MGELESFEQTINELLPSIPNTRQNMGPRLYVQIQVDRAICSSPRHFLDGKAIRSIDCDHRVLRYVESSSLILKLIEWKIMSFIP